MKNTKRILALLMAVLTLFALAGCGSSKNSSYDYSAATEEYYDEYYGERGEYNGYMEAPAAAESTVTTASGSTGLGGAKTQSAENIRTCPKRSSTTRTSPWRP